MKRKGINTIAIAKKLKENLERDKLRYPGIELFWDLGKPSEPGVGRPTTYMGRRYGRDATLSVVDIVLTKNKKVFLAVEIEESKQVNPKTVLGDIFGILLCDKLRFQKKDYLIKKSVVIVAIAVSNKGKRAKKYKRFERHLKRYLTKHPSESVSKIRVIPCTTSELIRWIERLIRFVAGKEI